MANLSSFITQTVNSPSREPNLISAPSQSSIWTATGLTLSTTSTTGELPLAGFSPTAVKFGLTGSTTSAYVDFDVPTAMLNTKLALQWYARASVTTIGSITLSLQSYASATNRTSNTSPTTVTLQTSSVASAAQSFQTTFDAASQQFFRLTLNFPAASGQWYSLAQMVVGPGQIVQGAAISEWQSITFAVPTGLGAGSGTNTAFFRRVGSDMELRLRFVKDGTPGTGSSTVTFTMPIGYTINISQLNNGYMGYGSFSGSTFGSAADVQTGSSTTFYLREVGAATNITGADMIASSEIQFQLRIPIAEWTGSGTVNLGPGAQIEYLSHDGTSQTSSWALVPNLAGASGNLTYNLTPQFACQSDDVLEIELRESFGNVISNSAFPLIYGTSSFIFGMQARKQSNGQIAVVFGSGGLSPLNGLGAAATGGFEWSALRTGGWQWRVRKAKASSPVGFGLAAAGTSGLVSSESTGTASVWLKAIGGADITGPVTIRWTRVGKIVTVLIPAISASTVNTQLTLSTTQTSGVNTWPTEITPARQHYCIYSAVSSTTYSAALIGINSSGVCQLFTDMAGSSFTGSTVVKGVGVATTITYMLD